MRGVVLDVGGKQIAPRGDFRPLRREAIRSWWALNIMVNARPHIWRSAKPDFDRSDALETSCWYLTCIGRRRDWLKCPLTISSPTGEVKKRDEWSLVA